jgi:hypothetical protein
MVEKICTKCNINKSILDYYKNKKYTNGYSLNCKSCIKQYYIDNKQKKKEYRSSDEFKTKKIEYDKKYYYENREQRIQTVTKYNRETNYPQIWHKINKDKVSAYHKINRKKLNSQTKERYKNNIQFKLKVRLRLRLLDALRKDNITKNHSALLLIGCSIEEFKNHLESMFLNGMSWENHGIIWEIDHIKPCSSFDLINIDQQLECFNYKNHQPLFKTTEIAKSFGYLDHIGNRNKSDRIF